MPQLRIRTLSCDADPLESRTPQSTTPVPSCSGASRGCTRRRGSATYAPQPSHEDARASQDTDGTEEDLARNGDFGAAINDDSTVIIAEKLGVTEEHTLAEERSIGLSETSESSPRTTMRGPSPLQWHSTTLSPSSAVEDQSLDVEIAYHDAGFDALAAILDTRMLCPSSRDTSAASCPSSRDTRMHETYDPVQVTDDDDHYESESPPSTQLVYYLETTDGAEAEDPEPETCFVDRAVITTAESWRRRDQTAHKPIIKDDQHVSETITEDDGSDASPTLPADQVDTHGESEDVCAGIVFESLSKLDLRTPRDRCVSHDSVAELCSVHSHDEAPTRPFTRVASRKQFETLEDAWNAVPPQRPRLD